MATLIENDFQIPPSLPSIQCPLTKRYCSSRRLMRDQISPGFKDVFELGSDSPERDAIWANLQRSVLLLSLSDQNALKPARFLASLDDKMSDGRASVCYL